MAKRKGERVAAALRKAADDPQPEVRLAALYALAEFPDAAHDAILERSKAHVARLRLAETLRASGDKQASARICKAILASDAPEPQKKAVRLAISR